MILGLWYEFEGCLESFSWTVMFDRLFVRWLPVRWGMPRQSVIILSERLHYLVNRHHHGRPRCWSTFRANDGWARWSDFPWSFRRCLLVVSHGLGEWIRDSRGASKCQNRSPWRSMMWSESLWQRRPSKGINFEVCDGGVYCFAQYIENTAPHAEPMPGLGTYKGVV